MNKRNLILTLIIAIMLSGCTSKVQVESPYNDTITSADVLIEIPTLRQYGGYTCGTTCVQMLINWLFPYEGDLNLTTYEEELGTSEEFGTPPKNIVNYFVENGISINANEHMTISDLITAINAKHPIMICIQAWSSADDGTYNTSDSTNAETYLVEGHWVICVGYKKMESGYRLFFNDPACVGHCFMDEEELDKRWIDMDGSGKIYDHYGIEIIGTAAYDSNGAFHLD